MVLLPNLTYLTEHVDVAVLHLLKVAQEKAVRKQQNTNKMTLKSVKYFSK
jgi:hypothetical protein